ncbi:STAS domain-containing protein [Candidatus Sumerlaeota bacterium]|nr:STAS domain-containing protein [Candidatus Sumerlaeota bacterium]
MKYQINCTEENAADIDLLDAFDRDSAGEFERETRELCRNGRVNITLNLEYLNYLDSASLGMLVMLRAHVKRHNGELRLKNLKPQLMKTMRNMRLDIVFGLTEM